MIKKKTTKQSLPLQPTFADDQSLRSIILSISLQVESVIHMAKDCGRLQVLLGRLNVKKVGMEQENGERIGAFGVFYSVDMST